MAWGTEQSTALGTVTDTEEFTANITLNPGESAHCEVNVDFPTTPTDNAVVSVYGSLDAGTDYDDTPLLSFEIDNATDPNQLSFLVHGVYSFRIGVKASGATDTLTTVDVRWRKNGVSL